MVYIMVYENGPVCFEAGYLVRGRSSWQRAQESHGLPHELLNVSMGAYFGTKGRLETRGDVVPRDRAQAVKSESLEISARRCVLSGPSEMPACLVGATDRFQHPLVLPVDVDTERVFAVDARWVDIVDKDWHQ